MCGQPGYVFRDFCLKQGIEFINFCLKQGIKNRNSVLNRVGKSAIFVLNRVRVWGAAPHLPTQGYIEYPLPGFPPQSPPGIAGRTGERSRSLCGGESSRELSLWATNRRGSSLATRKTGTKPCKNAQHIGFIYGNHFSRLIRISLYSCSFVLFGSLVKWKSFSL